MYFLSILNLIMPFVMILVGSILRKHPVTDMKSNNGYNTPTSRKSQEHWDYAQSIAPDDYISLGEMLGVIEISLCVVMFLLHISVDITLIAGSCVGFGFLFLGFYKTDSEIEKKFAER